MSNRRSNLLGMGIVAILLFISSLKGAGTLYHVPPPSPQEGEPVLVKVVVDSDVPVAEAKLLHRTVGQSSYHEVLMRREGEVWKGVIPGSSVSAEGLEYLIVVGMADGSVLGFPEEDPFSTPYALSVASRQMRGRLFEKEEGAETEGSLLEADILVISPEEGETVKPDELLIVVSLFNVTGVDVSSIRLSIDGNDITSGAAVSSDIVTYSPDDIDPGFHTARIQLRNVYGYALQPVTWSFSVAGREAEIITALDEFSYSGKTRVDFSLDQAEDEALAIVRSQTVLEGGWQWLSFQSDVRITTEETKTQQPKNRYSAMIRSGDNLTVKLGDLTPVLSPYTIDGKRVRGIGIDVNLSWLRFQMVNGELQRAVQGNSTELDDIYRVTDIEIDSESGQPEYVFDRLGYTFTRNVQAYRLGLRYKNRYRLALNLQKAKDEPSSIVREIDAARFELPNVENYVTVAGIDSGVYTFAQFKDEIEGIAKYRLDSKDWGGDKPQDNIVFGFDGGMAFDDQRLTFTAAWAMSLLNRDIWPGAMTLTQLDTVLDDSIDGFVGRTYDENGLITSLGFSLEDLTDPSLLEDFFVVNQNMVPLIPIDLESYQDNRLAALMNMPSVAYRLKMRAYYYQNTLQLEYSQVGPEFSSLANPYLSKNLREFTISDRIRLLDSKLLVSASFRHRDNKILKTVTDPYSQNTARLNFTLIPGVGLPSFTFNLQSVHRDNKKTELDTLIFMTQSGDSLVFQDLREDSRTRNTLFSLNFPVKAKNALYNFTASMNSINVDDLLEDKRLEGYSSPNTQSRSFSLGASTQYEFPLRTSFDITRYTIELPVTASAGEVIVSESRLTSMAFKASYAIWSGKMKFDGGLSYLNVGGVSRYGNYGANGAVEIRPLKNFSTRLSLSGKVNQTGKKIKLGTLAVKLSGNYLF